MAKENKKEISFVEGPIFQSLIRFALPVLGALILQAAYGAVDLLVVGRFGSTSGLSAVSTGSQVLNLVTFVVTQLAMGVTVLIARYLGERCPEQIGAVIGGAAVVFALVSALLFAVPVGLAAFFLRAVLYKVLGGTLADGIGVGAGEGNWTVTNVFCIVVFVLAIMLGLILGGSFKRYWALMQDSGFGADYGAKYGAGTAIMNFGIYGLFIVLYYNLIGANWNAATIGCVFCMVCCCFKGSQPRNVLPIMLGYVLASFAAKGLCAALGTQFAFPINAQAIVIGLCFANGLSPVAGKYGWLAGILFGVLHYALVTSVPLTHGGFLLYNGGFTAALICFLFIPVMEMFFKTKDERRELKAK